MDYYAIGQRVRKFTKARNISQEQLAEQIGISVTHMSHIETGNTKLSLPVLVDLAAALEVRSDELLFDNDMTERSAVCNEVSDLLDTCTTQQIKIMLDILKAAKISLNKYL